MAEDDYYDSGDRRLLRLGIDPDGDPLEIYLELNEFDSGWSHTRPFRRLSCHATRTFR
jgi:hypothetical protein